MDENSTPVRYGFVFDNENVIGTYYKVRSAIFSSYTKRFIQDMGAFGQYARVEDIREDPGIKADLGEMYDNTEVRNDKKNVWVHEREIEQETLDEIESIPGIIKVKKCYSPSCTNPEKSCCLSEK